MKTCIPLQNFRTMPGVSKILTTTSMTLLYYHRYQRYNKMFLNEFIALQSVRDEYNKELTKPILLPEFSGGYLKIHARGSGHRAILLVFIYNIVITIAL